MMREESRLCMKFHASLLHINTHPVVNTLIQRHWPCPEVESEEEYVQQSFSLVR